eukprot:2463483-Rhodomonas_salina.2
MASTELAYRAMCCCESFGTELGYGGTSTTCGMSGTELVHSTASTTYGVCGTDLACSVTTTSYGTSSTELAYGATRQPRGNALLVGVGGSGMPLSPTRCAWSTTPYCILLLTYHSWAVIPGTGRQSLTRLSSYITEMKCFQVLSTRDNVLQCRSGSHVGGCACCAAVQIELPNNVQCGTDRARITCGAV